MRRRETEELLADLDYLRDATILDGDREVFVIPADDPGPDDQRARLVSRLRYGRKGKAEQ